MKRKTFYPTKTFPRWRIFHKFSLEELVRCVSWRLNFTALKWKDLDFLPISKVARTSSTINYSHLITVTYDEQEMVWRTFPFCCAKPFKAPTKLNSIVGNPSQSEIPAKVGAHKRKSSYWIYAELSGRKVTESILFLDIIKMEISPTRSSAEKLNQMLVNMRTQIENILGSHSSGSATLATPEHSRTMKTTQFVIHGSWGEAGPLISSTTKKFPLWQSAQPKQKKFHIHESVITIPRKVFYSWEISNKS